MTLVVTVDKRSELGGSHFTAFFRLSVWRFVFSFLPFHPHNTTPTSSFLTLLPSRSVKPIAASVCLSLFLASYHFSPTPGSHTARIGTDVAGHGLRGYVRESMRRYRLLPSFVNRRRRSRSDGIMCLVLCLLFFPAFVTTPSPFTFELQSANAHDCLFASDFSATAGQRSFLFHHHPFTSSSLHYLPQHSSNLSSIQHLSDCNAASRKAQGLMLCRVTHLGSSPLPRARRPPSSLSIQVKRPTGWVGAGHRDGRSPSSPTTTGSLLPFAFQDLFTDILTELGWCCPGCVHLGRSPLLGPAASPSSVQHHGQTTTLAEAE
jgi:hypothetical protein